MALISPIVTSSITVDSTFSVINNLIGLYSEIMVTAGFTVISDSVGNSTTMRIITHQFKQCPYYLQLTGFSTWGMELVLNVLALDKATILSAYSTGYIYGYNGSPANGGIFNVLTGPNTVLLNFVGSNGPTSTIAFLKFSDNNWYCWGPIVGGLLDNVTNAVHPGATPPIYPALLNGNYLMIPWYPQQTGLNTVWNIYALSACSIVASQFNNNFFYKVGTANYFYYGNLMISDQ